MQGLGGNQAAKIYEAVRSSGLPNCMSARIPLPSGLIIPAWEKYIDFDTDEAQLFDYLRFGFPLGYMGPESDTRHTPNHSSAVDYPGDIEAFIRKEHGHGALLGPFLAHPFHPWAHTSPIMSRPKSDGVSRRVITDLTFPEESSVNAYIFKNSVLGQVRDHSLPTVAEFVEVIKDMGQGSYMFTVDLERAYKNVRIDPLDWPLLCVRWKDLHYVETAMPFGAHSSSANMQRVANLIVRVLTGEGIKTRMYLDDLIAVAPTRAEAQHQYARVQALLRELGLPEAADKAQPPSTQVKWLGIIINSVDMSLSIPDGKLAEVLDTVKACAGKRSIHRRKYESLLGKLMHIAKCVQPARAFMSRLLQALRESQGWFVKVTPAIRADLAWFTEFAEHWNGTAIIPPDNPSIFIQVDASLTGIGGTDGHRAYSGRVAQDDDPARDINELEAINVIVALHTFLSQAHKGQHILVEWDNLATVQAIKWGRARNEVLAECARMAWMVQAVLDVSISFTHIAGVNNDTADALSRAHMNHKHYQAAADAIQAGSLKIVSPCLHALKYASSCVKSRSRLRLATTEGSIQADSGEGTRHQGQPPGSNQGTGMLRATVRDGSGQHDRNGHLPVDRIHGRTRGTPRHDPQQGVACTHLYTTGRGRHDGHHTLQSSEGTGCSGAQQGQASGDKGASASDSVQEGAYLHSSHRQPTHQDKVGQNSSAVQPDAHHLNTPNRRSLYMPGAGGSSLPGRAPGPLTESPTTGVHKDRHANDHGISALYLGRGPEVPRAFPCAIRPTQPEKSLRHRGGEEGMLRT